MDAKEEVRARLSIEDVIGDYVQLKRAGRSFKGLSPWTGERTPSFYVSPDKQIWHDFSSGKGGDVFAFIMEVEGLDFRQALEQLARRAGVDLSIYQSEGSQKLAARKRRILAASDLAAKYFQHCMIKTKSSQEYIFGKRELSKQTVQDFRIGYAPDSKDGLIKFLRSRGFNPAEINDAGLANRFGGDLFRGRMAVPLMDQSGQVIGFTGRILTDDPKAPKYLNTPATIVYDKSRHVFGLSQAKEAIRKNNYSVVVEGNLDVVSSHQAGIKQVVATAGTAMTEYHLKALVRLGDTIKLAFDNDKAGLAATERTIEIASQIDINLEVVTLPDDAKDADELVKKDPALWISAIEHSIPVVDWVIAQYKKREDLTTAAGKRAYASAAIRIIRSLKDSVEQEHYLKQVASDCDIEPYILRKRLEDDKQPEKNLKEVKPNPSHEKTIRSRGEEAFLAVALTDSNLQDLIASINTNLFSSKQSQAIADFIVKNKGKTISSVPPDLQEYEKYVTMLMLNPDVERVDWNEENRIITATDVIRKLKENYKKNNSKEVLIKEERDARTRGDDEAANDALIKLNQLIKEK